MIISFDLLSRRSALLSDLLWLLKRYVRTRGTTALIIACLFLAAYALQISAFLAAIKYLSWATRDPHQMPSLATQLGLNFFGLSLCVTAIIIATFCSASISLYWARKLSTETSISMITGLEEELSAYTDHVKAPASTGKLLHEHLPQSADALRQMLLSTASVTNALLSLLVMFFLKPWLTAALTVPVATLVLVLLASTRHRASTAALSSVISPADSENTGIEPSSQNSLFERDRFYRTRMASQSRSDKTRLMFQLVGGLTIGVILAVEAIAIMDNVSSPQRLIFYLIAARLATNNFSSLATQWAAIAHRASHVRKVRQFFSGSSGNEPV